jgi:hypothetical protein
MRRLTTQLCNCNNPYCNLVLYESGDVLVVPTTDTCLPRRHSFSDRPTASVSQPMKSAYPIFTNFLCHQQAYAQKDHA